MKLRGYYCKICGRCRSNERFSGRGHRAHICKDCAKFPVEKRNEMLTINRLMDLPFYVSKDQRAWLEKMRKDERKAVRETAEWAYGMRFGAAAGDEMDVIDIDEADMMDAAQLMLADADADIDWDDYEDPF